MKRVKVKRGWYELHDKDMNRVARIRQNDRGWLAEITFEGHQRGIWEPTLREASYQVDYWIRQYKLESGK